MCVARTWAATLATDFNGEPGYDAVAGGPEVKVSRDCLRQYFGRCDRAFQGRATPLSVDPIARCASPWELPLERKFIPERLRCFAPRVAMVQTTEARHRSHVCARGRLRLDSPLVRGVLCERVVNSVLMVIGYVITHEPE